jgi:AcrR family transcriptional regulator
MIHVYSIKELVQETGVARTTIHFYLRQGLLPRAQKTAASRSLYTQEHVDILRRIAELKAGGRSLQEIQGELRGNLERAQESAVDLAAQEYDRTHTRILAAAADEFANKGYTNTHVTAIMRQLGITATLFYTHFPSKRALLAKCVEFSTRSVVQPAHRRREIAEDAAEKVLRAVAARARSLELALTAAALREVEGDEDADLRGPVENAIAPIVEAIERGLGPDGPANAGVPTVTGHLIALALYGAYENPALRVLFPERCGREDLLRALLWLFLAAEAARTGELDISSRFAQYESLLCSLPPA